MTPDRHAPPHGIDLLVRRLSPADDAAVDDRPDDAGARALFEAIVTERPTSPAATVAARPAPHRRRWATIVLSAAAVTVVVTALTLVASSPSAPPSGAATRSVTLHTSSGTAITGRIPNEAFRDGRIVWSKVPTYIPVYSGRSLVGYVRKVAVEHPPVLAGPFIEPLHLPGAIRLCTTGGVDVYNAARALVGHIVGDTGFVPLGARPVCGT